MVLIVFKSEATNLTPRVVSYRRYNPFDNDKFKLQISYNLAMQDPSTMDYKNFRATIIDSLKMHAPTRMLIIRTS